MASQIISGPSNPTYINDTGQNVRVVINFLRNPTSVNWAGVSANTATSIIPKQIMLAPNQSFSARCGAYNIVVIKEDGT